MNISVMNSKDNWNIFSKNRNAIYGVAIISIMIFHFFEDIAAYSARTAHPFQRNGAPFRFKLSKAQQVD